jgi:hypothetical protein
MFPPLTEHVGRSEFTHFAEYLADTVDSEWFAGSAPPSSLSSRSFPLNIFIVMRMLPDVAQMTMPARLGAESASDVTSFGASALSRQNSAAESAMAQRHRVQHVGTLEG